jgi:hypothetical protein
VFFNDFLHLVKSFAILVFLFIRFLKYKAACSGSYLRKIAEFFFFFFGGGGGGGGVGEGEITLFHPKLLPHFQCPP